MMMIITHYTTQPYTNLTSLLNQTHNMLINIWTKKYSINKRYSIFTLSIKQYSKLFPSKYTDGLINAQYKLMGWTYGF